jgi:hypothetical protein
MQKKQSKCCCRLTNKSQSISTKYWKIYEKTSLDKLSNLINIVKGKILKDYKLIVNKSRVTVGTANKVKAAFRNNHEGEIDIVSNPDFLGQGVSVSDFMKPDRMVFRTTLERPKKLIERLIRVNYNSWFLFKLKIRYTFPLILSILFDSLIDLFSLIFSMLRSKIFYLSKLNFCEK